MLSMALSNYVARFSSTVFNHQRRSNTGTNQPVVSHPTLLSSNLERSHSSFNYQNSMINNNNNHSKMKGNVEPLPTLVDDGTKTTNQTDYNSNNNNNSNKTAKPSSVSHAGSSMGTTPNQAASHSVAMSPAKRVTGKHWFRRIFPFLFFFFYHFQIKAVYFI